MIHHTYVIAIDSVGANLFEAPRELFVNELHKLLEVSGSADYRRFFSGFVKRTCRIAVHLRFARECRHSCHRFTVSDSVTWVKSREYNPSPEPPSVLLGGTTRRMESCAAERALSGRGRRFPEHRPRLHHAFAKA